MEVIEMSEFEKNENIINDEELDEVAGGRGSSHHWKTVTCHVQKGYLALRSAPAYKRENELDQIYNGHQFKIRPDKRSGAYVWSKYHGIEGWTNSNYSR